MKDEILIQRALRVKYDRCVTVCGARLVEVGDESGTTAGQLASAIGPKTVAAAKAYLGVRLTDMRLGFLKGLPTWTTFGRGWSNRINDVYAVVRDLCSR